MADTQEQIGVARWGAACAPPIAESGGGHCWTDGTQNQGNVETGPPGTKGRLVGHIALVPAASQPSSFLLVCVPILNALSWLPVAYFLHAPLGGRSDDPPRKAVCGPGLKHQQG